MIKQYFFFKFESSHFLKFILVREMRIFTLMSSVLFYLYFFFLNEVKRFCGSKWQDCPDQQPLTSGSCQQQPLVQTKVSKPSRQRKGILTADSSRLLTRRSVSLARRITLTDPACLADLPRPTDLAGQKAIHLRLRQQPVGELREMAILMREEVPFFSSNSDEVWPRDGLCLC